MQDHDFKFKPSRQYLIFLAAALTACAVIVAALSAAWWLRAGLFVLLLVYGGWMIWQFGLLRGSASITAVRRLSDGDWLLQTRQGEYRAALLGDSTVTLVVSVLRFRVNQEKRVRTCIVFHDSLPNGRYRELVVVCRVE